MKRSLVAALGVLVCVSAGAWGSTAKGILEATGVRGGLVVHVGCGDGKLTADLGAEGRCTVHGLDTDVAYIAKAREHIAQSVQAGRVAVAKFDGRHLPYADNLVNLLIAEDLGDVPMDEVMRVLCPRGVAYVKTGGTWKKTVKPVPPSIDDWSHYLHGADNNAVARDMAVGPPRRMQWVAGPHFARSHELNSSMAAMISAGGTLFYIWDEGPSAVTDQRMPANWKLIARDAFNGLVLWKRPMPRWGWRQWHASSRWSSPRERARMLRLLPATLPRRLVAGGGRVYVTLGYDAPVSVLDAATGERISELEQTALTDEILLDGNSLVLRVRVADSPPEKDVWDKVDGRARARIVVVDAETGRTRWRSKLREIAPLTLATRAGRVFFSDYQRVVCLDLKDGRPIWRSEPTETLPGHRGMVGTLVAQDQVVLYTAIADKRGSGTLQALSAKTGKLLWRGPKHAGPGITNPPDVFVAAGLVWPGETKLPVSWSQTELRRQGLDLMTGKVVREVVVPKLISWGHHYRCYRSKATERFLLLPKRGVEFVDLVGKDHMRHDWLRAPCIYGMLPANGLLYAAPHQCVCYQGVLLSNFNALAPAGTAGAPPEPKTRLRKGPAFGEPSAVAKDDSPQDWPMYRRDAQRSGAAAGDVGDTTAEKWGARLRGPLTPPVVARKRLLVAEVDAHTVRAFDAESGKAAWGFTAGGRVDSPPTIRGDLVLFGSADGYVHCLRLEDGRQVWRFQAAPNDRRIVSFGQVESAWPVHGSVLVQRDPAAKPPRDVAYVTAGRSSFLDGGIRLYGLDARTGKVLCRSRLDGPRPDPMTEQGGAGYMDGASTDLLVSDGADIYMFQERFRSDLKRIPASMERKAKESGGSRVYPAAAKRGSSGQRLITTHGFLNDQENEGKYWTFGRRWPGWDRKMRKVGAYGQLLVFDDRCLYGVHVFTDDIRVRRGRDLGGRGQRVFARDHGQGKDRWSVFVPLHVRAMVLAGDKLYIAGPRDVIDPDDPLAGLQGRRGAELWVLSAGEGKKLWQQKLAAPPVYDGMIAAGGRLYLSTADGRVVCLATR